MAFLKQENNVVLTELSTTTPLANSATFTSAFYNVSRFSSIVIAALTDKVGTLYLDFSPDGTNVDSTLSWSVAASTNEVHRITITRKFARVRFTNTSAETQGFLRLQTMVGDHSGLTFNLGATTLPTDWDSTVTRTVIAGVDPNDSFINEKVGGYKFQTSTLLNANAQYTSSLMSLDGFTQIETSIFANVIGTLTGSWYSDSAGTNLIRTFYRPYTSDDIDKLVYFSGPIYGPYLKYTYNNGSSNQSNFYLSLKLQNQPISGQIIGLDDFIPNNVVANLGRNVIVGSDAAGNYRNLQTDSEGHIKVNIDEPLTAFGELKVAASTPFIQITSPYGINQDLILTGSNSAGSVTYNDSLASVVASTGASTNSSASFQSRRLAKYRNGQGMNIRFTSVFTQGVTGSYQLAGWGDSTGGFFVGYSGSTFGILHRLNSTAETFIPQTQWNIDTFDGSSNYSNPSGELLDPTKGNVYEIQAQWLGYGGIKFSIESNESGQYEPAHLIKYANTSTTPTVLNPTFPISFTTRNLTNNTNLSISSPSMAAFIEGDIKYTGQSYSADGASGASGTKNMLTIYNPPTYNTKTNKTVAVLKNISLVTDGTQNITFSLIKNATLTTPSYTQVSTYTPIQSDTVGTSPTGGRSVFKTLMNKTSNQTIDLSSYDIMLNPGETLSVVSVGTNASATVSLTWIDDV